MSEQIHAAIIAVMKKIGPIGKDSENKEQRYKFRSIDDIYDRLQPVMASEGMFTAPNLKNLDHETVTTSNNKTAHHFIAEVEFTFYAEDGSSIAVTTIGEAIDWSDKAGNKAMSAAHKYALVQVFMLPYKEMDPDEFTPEWAGRAEDRVTASEFKRLSSDWFHANKSRLSGMSPSDREKEFTDWVHLCLADDTVPALEWKKWTRDQLQVCRQALNAHAEQSLSETGLA